MRSLARRVEELRDFHVRLHVNKRRVVTAIDGICRGVENWHVVLATSSLGERAQVPLRQVGAVTQLPGDFGKQR